jgi:hypothetical protein
MRLDFQLVERLPKLAWVARVHRDEERVDILHGPWVETRGASFVEGAWDGDFGEGGFDTAISFMGSGGRSAGDRVVFAGPTHKLERLQSVAVGDRLYVSNSFALLLALAGEDLDPRYPNYLFDYLRYFRAGLTMTVKPIRLRSGNHAYLHDCCNLVVRRDLTIERLEKRVPPEPGGYREYAGFLERTAQQVTANAMDPARKRVFRPVAAISRGYDSVAVAAVASRAHCKRAVTFRHSSEEEIEDSGAAIAAVLGMEVKEYNRSDYARAGGLPEVEFYPYTRLASKAYRVFEEELTGSLFINGQAGEDYWGTSWECGLPLLQEPGATTMAGSNMTEFRLRVGTIFFPLPVCGALHAPALTRIGRSKEMAAWSIEGSYDRPIPRRLAEERGVPRNLFGQLKVGGGPEMGSLGLCPESEADFQASYAEFAGGKVAREKDIPQAVLKRRQRWVQPLRRIVFSSTRLNRLFRRFLGDRLDSRWGSLSLYTLHWSFYRLKERYERQLAGQN